MYSRPVVCLLLVSTAVVCARADTLPGVDVTGGAKVSTELTPTGDVDDYAFHAVAGQSVKVTAKLPKKDAPELTLELLAPDGSVLTEADGVTPKSKGRKRELRAVLASGGAYVARVRTPDGRTTGSYSLKVVHELPKLPRKKGLLADVDGRIRFTVPGAPGVTIGFDVQWKGDAPTIESIAVPGGGDLPGAVAAVKAKGKHKLLLKAFPLGLDAATGDYVITLLVAPDDGTRKLKAKPRVERDPAFGKRKGALSADEPRITVQPDFVAPSGMITLQGSGFVDQEVRDGLPHLLLGTVEITDVTVSPEGTSVVASVPAGVALGDAQLCVVSATGQVARGADLTVVAPPAVIDLQPTIGTAAGGVDVTITGSGLRAGRLQLLVNGGATQSAPLEVTPTSYRFRTPSTGVGGVSFGLRDLDTGVEARLASSSYEAAASASVTSVTPSILPTLGGDRVQVTGEYFLPTDSLRLERPDGSFEELTASQITYVNSGAHTFLAPVRAPGTYRLDVSDSRGLSSPREQFLTYYSLADLTADLGLGDAEFGAVNASAIVDFDDDGRPDLVLASEGGATVGAASLLRVLRSSEDGLVDVTDTVGPDVTLDDDWRARRVFAADVTEDGRPDLILMSNDTSALPEDRPRVRILENRSSPDGRAFVDATDDLMAPVRMRLPFTFGENVPEVGDTWRGLDLWVGDLDGDAGRPELVVTGDVIRSDDNEANNGWNCDPPGPGYYCALANGATATYAFYWSATRVFRWNEMRRSGLGQFAFAFNAMPRAQGVIVPQVLTGLPTCNSNQPCEGTFAPFVGSQVVVGDFDGDDDLDLAVLTDEEVRVDGDPTSSLELGLRGFDAGTFFSEFGDITRIATEIGLDLRGDALAVGTTTYPDGVPHAALAISTSTPSPGTSSVLRVFHFVEPETDDRPIAFEEITEHVVPPTTATERWQADELAFVDIDGDGDDDLVVSSADAPGPDGAAVRILRSGVVGQVSGVFETTLQPMVDALVTGTDALGGDGLTLGDLAGDGNLTLVLTRTLPTGDDPSVRVLATQTE